MLSAVFHVEALCLGAGLVREHEAAEARRKAQRPVLVEVDLDARLGPSFDGEALPRVSARSLFDPPPRGGEVTPRFDDGRRGRGGERAGEAAVNLAPSDDGATATRTEASRIDRSQEARRRTRTGARRSPEDDLVTPSPMILTFYATGMASQPLPEAFVAPARRRGATSPAHAGRTFDVRPSALGHHDHRLVVGRPGGPTSPGSGASKASVSRPAAWASPDALQGRIAARTKDLGAARDRVSSEQEVALRDPSWLAASAAGGDGSAGRGGQVGDVRPGAGGERGAGATSRAQGDGTRGGTGYDPADRRRTLYLRRVKRRIHNAWGAADFPAGARARGLGGTSIVAFTILRNGQVTGVRTVRPSGFPSFDAAIRRAVIRVAPFPPLPEVFATDAWTDTYQAVAVNPAVR